MTIKLLIDMNLSPGWVDVLKRQGWQAVHWSRIGDPRALDRTLMQWAQTNGYVIFTHDLDFGTLLAASHAEGPSVIQIRTQDVLPEHLEAIVIAALRQYETLLQAGALVIVNENNLRARVLPLRSR
jgi:predicted nuclease of predicted toxin-antitoxin system